VLVDDGIATGATMKAAVLALRGRKPARLIAALPVAPPHIEDEFSGLVDAFVCIAQPFPFFSVGLHYADFEETSDDDVRALLHRGWDRNRSGPH